VDAFIASCGVKEAEKDFDKKEWRNGEKNEQDN